MIRADPQRDALYAAEDESLAGLGPELRRWRDVVACVESVVLRPEWIDAPTEPPTDVIVERRSRSARFAAADRPSGTIWIPDVRWNAPTVPHEPAHLVAVTPEPHGAAFAAAELWLVRWRVGIDAFAALRAAFDRHGVRYEGPCVPMLSRS
ncbi:MAG: hypothetical protein IT195_04010 [Microthrixaceae bacterium]|nr:hypothetical protein [Microthrixaceae bacterium]